MWWSKSKTYEVKLEEGITWKDKYAEYHSKGWQWDNENCNSKILLTNNNFSAHLVTGYTYHGLRTTRSEESGRHYFEVLISPTEDDSKFNRVAARSDLMILTISFREVLFIWESELLQPSSIQIIAVLAGQKRIVESDTTMVTISKFQKTNSFRWPNLCIERKTL